MRKTTPLLLAALAFLLAGAECTTFKRWAYEHGDRDAWQQPDRVVEALGLASGDTVADVGSGSGYFTGRLARAVAPAGKVYAVDVDEAMNRYLAERMEEEGVTNVEVVLATPDDPGVPEGTIDLLFTSNTYHHLPEGYFAGITQVLSPRGRIAIVEYDGDKAGWFARTFGHQTPKQAIAEQMAAGGFRLEQDHDFLERQSFQVFVPAAR